MASLKELARNYSIHLSGRILGTFFGVITIAILTRSLGDTGYGQLTTAMTFLQIFGVMVDFGLTLTLVQMISEDKADETRITGGVLGLRLVSGVVFFGLAAFIGWSLPYPLVIKLAIAIGTLSYLFMTASGMLIGVFQKHLAIWRVALAELINRFVTLGVISLFAYLAYGVVAMMLAFVIGNFLQFVFTIYFARTFVKIWPRIDLPIWKDAFLRGWPIGLSILFNLIYLKSDILFLGWFRDQSEVGIYGASYKVLDVITSMPVMYMGLALPALVLSWSKDAKADFMQLMQRSFDFFAIISFPMFVGALVVGVPLMVFVSGSEFALSGELLKVLMLAAIAVFFGSLTGHAIVALGLQKVMIWGYAVTAVVTVIGYLLVIPPYGIWGAAWMTVAAEVLITIFTFSVVSYKSKFRPNMIVFLKAIAASAVMYGVLMVMPPINVLWMIVIGALVYGAVIFGIGGVKYSMIKDMLSRD